MAEQQAPVQEQSKQEQAQPQQNPNIVQINQGNVAQLELQLMAQIRDELAGIRKALEAKSGNNA